MTVLNQERTARKEHKCGWRCGDPILPGTRYVRSSLPPGGEMGYFHWQSAALHGHSLLDCPRYAPGGEGVTSGG